MVGMIRRGRDWPCRFALCALASDYWWRSHHDMIAMSLSLIAALLSFIMAILPEKSAE
jgi:hypothetical protein